MSTLILDTTTKSIQVSMSGVAATTNPDFTAAWADNNSTNFIEGASDGTLSGTTDVSVVSAPAAGYRRIIKYITIENKDTAPVTITVKYDNNGTQRTIAKVTLNVGDTWTTDGTFDTFGALKQAIATLNLSTSVTGTLAVSNGGTGATTLNGLAKGNGTSAFTAATAGTDYVDPSVASTYTATQTFNGSSSVLGVVLNDVAEVTTVSATAATGTINYDVTTQSVLYYTSNASANWTVNLRGSSGTSLNTLMSTGQTLTVVFMVTQGATPYFNNVIQVDGTTITPRWQGGVAPTAGNASGIDIYSYTIIKTASATFTVLAAQVQFK
jgi:hypothetical protein